ncbi:MAG TPA: hypothetical protein ENI80_10005 [Acidiferrobacteraceae bacterium]|nr:hypothetical protein [Acidiferrobacteraceae bacterium]
MTNNCLSVFKLYRFRFIIILIALCLALVYLDKQAVRIDGVTINLTDMPRIESYAVFLERHHGASAEDESAVKVAQRLAGKTKIQLKLPRSIRKRYVAIRLDLGDFPGVHVLTSLSFDATVLLWHIPVKLLSHAEVYAAIVSKKGISEITPIEKGLKIVATEEDPHFEVAIDVADIYRSANSVAFYVYKLILFAVFSVLVLLVVFADKVYVFLRRMVLGLICLVKGENETDSINAESFIRQNRIWLILAVSLFVAINLVRSWGTLSTPSLLTEDSYYFNYYYSGYADMASIANKPNGYLNIANNLVAKGISILDVRIQPVLYVILAFVLGTFTASMVIFSGYFRNKWLIGIVPVVLGLSGFNHIYYFTTLTYQMYVVVVLLLSYVVFFQVPRQYKYLLPVFMLCVLFVYSGPYSVTLIPLSMLLSVFLYNKRKAIFLVLLSLFVISYFVNVDSGTTTMTSFFVQERISYFVYVLINDIFLLGLVDDSAALFVFMAEITLLSVVMYSLRYDRLYIKLAVVLIAFVVAALLPYFMSSKYIPYFHRPAYILVAYYFWWIFLLWTAERLLVGNKKSLILAPLLSAVFVVLVVYDNYRHPAKGTDDRVNPAVMQFVHAVHAVEQLDLESKNQFLWMRVNDPYLEGSPTLYVGSTKASARRLESKNIKNPLIRRFIFGEGQGDG